MWNAYDWWCHKFCVERQQYIDDTALLVHTCQLISKYFVRCVASSVMPTNAYKTFPLFHSSANPASPPSPVASTLSTLEWPSYPYNTLSKNNITACSGNNMFVGRYVDRWRGKNTSAEEGTIFFYWTTCLFRRWTFLHVLGRRIFPSTVNQLTSKTYERIRRLTKIVVIYELVPKLESIAELIKW